MTEPTSAASAHPGAMNPQDYRAGEPLPPTPECEPGVYCPFTDNGAYHGVCLWHEGPERTCTCDGRTAHSTRPPEPDTAARPLAAWRDVDHRHRRFGFSIWLTGAEASIGRRLYRVRWAFRGR